MTANNFISGVINSKLTVVDNINLDNTELEQQVLEENIVSAVSLGSANLQIGLRGDPSLRETAIDRCRYESELDRLYNDIEPVFEDLLINRGIFRLFIGFNNSEVRTCSIFDPLREEIHDGKQLASPGYIERHFPAIPYAEKTAIMRKLYKALFKSEIYHYMPKHLQNIASKRHKVWQPMSQQDVQMILHYLQRLRSLPEYYLRNFSISTVQNVVRLQFNCDGTQIVHVRDFDTFIKENLP